MKHVFIFLTSLLLFFPGAISGQHVELGYYVQPQISNLSGSSNDSYDEIHNNQTGTLYSGFFIDYFLAKVVAVETGIAYGHLSQKFLYESMAMTSTNHYVFQVIKVPLQVQYMQRFGRIAIFAGGGPHLCYLLNAYNQTDNGSYSLTDDYSKMILGFGFETGFGFEPIPRLTIFLKPRFEFSSLSFQYTSENNNYFYPLGNHLVSNCIGTQIGICWSVK